MAFTQAQEVAPARPDNTASTLASDGNVIFGIVDAAGPPVDVLWHNGQFVEGLAEEVLDLILPIAAPQLVVTFSDASGGVQSPSYRGVIVRRYTRSRAGTGSPVSFTLIRLIETGQLLEVPTAAIENIPSM